MRVIRYAGVMLAAGLLWVVVGPLLRSIGLGQGATMVVGFVLLFVLGPLLLVLASGGKSSPAVVAEGEVQTERVGASRQVQLPEATPKSPAVISNETKVQGIVRKVVDHFRTQGLAPSTECWNNGNTCNVNVVIEGAQYKIQVMDPSGFQTMSWRLVGKEEITLGTPENTNPTDIDQRVVQLCRQVDQGRFNP